MYADTDVFSKILSEGWLVLSLRESKSQLETKLQPSYGLTS